MTAQTYQVTMTLQNNFPRDTDIDDNLLYWNEQSITEEITSWLTDLGFDLIIEVKETETIHGLHPVWDKNT